MLHFFGETYAHFLWGQFLPMLIVDYIAIGLLLLGVYGLSKLNWGPGLLCGAWGFELCLNYRTFFVRVESMYAGTADEVTIKIAYLLGSLMVISITGFIFSVYLCIKDHRRKLLDV